MYLRFECPMKFSALAQKLLPACSEDDLDWDSENVYEWMYIDLPQLDYSLNISREHGTLDVDYDAPPGPETGLLPEIQVEPGPIYVFGFRRGDTPIYMDDLSDWIAPYFAEKLSLEVSVFEGRPNVDEPDGDPVLVVCSS